MKFFMQFVCLGILAAAMASASTAFSVTFLQSTIVGGTELKAGDYRVEVDGDKAVIHMGKHLIEAPVKVQTDDKKHSATIVHYNNGDGKYHVSEILVGGSKTKLVFE